MNFGIVLLAMFLVGASIFGIIMIGSANQAPIVDTFGNTSPPTTNATMGTVTNVTAPLMSGAGGLAIILAIFVIFLAAVFVIKAAFGNTNYNTRR
jgi:hypothetical protein